MKQTYEANLQGLIYFGGEQVTARVHEEAEELCSEARRWGRSALDLFHTLQDLQAWDVSLVAQTGLQFGLRGAQGKLITSLMSGPGGIRVGFIV